MEDGNTELDLALASHSLRRYPRPGFTVDAAIVARPHEGKEAQILLVKRKKPPCQVILTAEAKYGAAEVITHRPQMAMSSYVLWY